MNFRSTLKTLAEYIYKRDQNLMYYPERYNDLENELSRFNTFEHLGNYTNMLLEKFDFPDVDKKTLISVLDSCEKMKTQNFRKVFFMELAIDLILGKFESLTSLNIDTVKIRNSLNNYNNPIYS